MIYNDLKGMRSTLEYENIAEKVTTAASVSAASKNQPPKTLLKRPTSDKEVETDKQTNLNINLNQPKHDLTKVE